MVDQDNFMPRDYQIELMELAIKENSIIYLPTGTGKTFIAVLVLKHLQRPKTKYSEGGKISFVVVNTVALVNQHAKCIEKRTNLDVGQYTGEMNLDFWPRTKWYEEFDKYQVLVMTIQILLNLTNQNFLDLNKVNLIVFDECHRGVSDQPMRQLCKSLENVAEKPRILGLTATLLNGNCKPNNIEGAVKKLETTYHSKIATVEGLDVVAGYSTNPKENIVCCSTHELSNVETLVIGILSQIIKTLADIKIESNPVPVKNALLSGLAPLTKEDGFKKLKNIVKDVIWHLNVMGEYGSFLTLSAHIIQIERLKRHCFDNTLFVVLSYVQTRFVIAKMLLKNFMDEEKNEYEKIIKYSSDKICKLIGLFDNFQQNSKEPLCCLIFAQRRFTAKIIYLILNELSKSSEKYSYLKTNFMVGYNNNPYNDTRENLYYAKKNKEVLQSFDNKEINVLCSSNVLEEGVDITTCSLVVKFDSPEDYRSYIQSKGRARNPASYFHMIVDRDAKSKFLIKYNEYRKTEQTLQELLVGKNELRASPTTEDIEKMYKEDLLPPYYVDGNNSAKVDMVSAISLLSQYCNSLPSDKYTIFAPQLYKNEKIDSDGRKLFQITIMLPTICPLLEPIVGKFMPNIKQAKRAAALLACEKLHKIGELDDHLLPKKCDISNEDIHYLFAHYPEKKEELAGTNGMKRKYKKQVPQNLRGPLKNSAWLHIIELQPVFEKLSDINNSTLYDIYTSNLCFGIITPTKVSTICDFPIYVSMGTINVHLNVNVRKVSLTQNLLQDIRKFNFLIYNDILKILKDFVVCDNGDDAEIMLLMPVNKDICEVDFQFFKDYQSVRSPMQELTTEEKINLKVTQESHLRKIVSPSYREMGDYLVTEVAFNKSAKDLFPNEQFGTYETYYREKHNVDLVNPTLPLLFVKPLTQKTNFLKPQGVQTKRRKDKNYDTMEIHLVPELVVTQDIPASIWIQANLIPTILSRFSSLFRLEEFRLKLSEELNLTNSSIIIKRPLDLDEYLLNYVPHLEKKVEINVIAPEPKDPFKVPSSISNLKINTDYAKILLEQEYPWKDSEEPKDIERNLDVTVFDVMFYDTFLSKSNVVEIEIPLRSELPKSLKPNLALTYFKKYEEKQIKLIDNQFIDETPELSLIYKAMTTAKANDIVNMERLETLGDSFLKLFSSLYTYLKFPKFTEGLATSLKSRLVSNKNLYYLGIKKNIEGLIKVNDLHAPDWLPPGFKVPDIIEKRIACNENIFKVLYLISIPPEEIISGDLSSDTIKQLEGIQSEEELFEESLFQDQASLFKCNYTGDKTIADCIEALLGAFFQTSGLVGGVKFLNWLGLLSDSEDFFELFQSVAKNPIIDASATLERVKFHLFDLENIETEILNYKFNNPAYLLQALTHSSYSPNRLTQSYEILEFIGDAILDFLITCYIFESCGNLDPGELTDLRSALVNNNTFASIVVRNNLHKSLLMLNSKLQILVDRFADYMISKKYEVDDEVLILLDDKDAEGLHIAEYIDVPKVLGDIFESIAGAIYLDCGKDLKIVWKVFHRLMWQEIETFSANVPKNLIRRLYEFTPNPHPQFSKVLSKNHMQDKEAVSLKFMLDGRPQQVYGFGSNKFAAKRAAAKLALRQLK